MDASELDFEQVTEADCSLLLHFLEEAGYEESNHNIVNMFQWRRQYPLWKCATANYLLLLGIHEGKLFIYMPLCREEFFDEAIIQARHIFTKAHVPFMLSCFTEHSMEKVLKLFPTCSSVCERDASDYIYEAEKLRTFSGKKLQKRRNHINAFMIEYKDRYRYEEISTGNLAEVKDFLYHWKETDIVDDYFHFEKQGAMDILDLFGKLPYQGGLIRIDDEVRAFVIGSLTSPRMVQINIEKADETIRGLYQVVEKEFLNHHYLETTLVNREDDMGLENLRAAKMALAPSGFIEKYRLRECNENNES